jgi:hypothetical protein
MKETNHHVLSTWTWGLVNETNTLALNLNESIGNAILHSKGNMMNTLTAIGKPLGNSTVL